MIKILHKPNTMRSTKEGGASDYTPVCVVRAYPCVGTCLCVSVSPEGISSICNITVSVQDEAE